MTESRGAGLNTVTTQYEMEMYSQMIAASIDQKYQEEINEYTSRQILNSYPHKKKQKFTVLHHGSVGKQTTQPRDHRPFPITLDLTNKATIMGVKLFFEKIEKNDKYWSQREKQREKKKKFYEELEEKKMKLHEEN